MLLHNRRLSLEIWCGKELGPNCSMIERSGIVSFVHWHHQRPWWGQILKWDDHKRLKYPMPVIGKEPAQNLAGCRLVEPDIGCRIVKPRADREEVPKHIWTLKTMWETGISHGAILSGQYNEHRHCSFQTRLTSICRYM